MDLLHHQTGLEGTVNMNSGSKNITDRITEYLAAGGLFNPEMMEHEKVRDLLMDARGELEELEAIREYLWPNQTGLSNHHRSALLAIKARERLSQSTVLKAIKKEALSCTNGQAGLAHIVRLCIDAGVTEGLGKGL